MAWIAGRIDMLRAQSHLQNRNICKLYTSEELWNLTQSNRTRDDIKNLSLVKYIIYLNNIHCVELCNYDAFYFGSTHTNI